MKQIRLFAMPILLAISISLSSFGHAYATPAELIPPEPPTITWTQVDADPYTTFDIIKKDDPPQALDTPIVIFKVICGLGIVVLLLFIVARLVSKRKWIGRSALYYVVNATPIGPGKSIHTVKIGKNVYVLGVGNEITLLDKITDESQIREMLDTQEEQHGFLKYLKTMFRTQQESETYQTDTFRTMFESKLGESISQRKTIVGMIEEQNKSQGGSHKHEN